MQAGKLSFRLAASFVVPLPQRLPRPALLIFARSSCLVRSIQPLLPGFRGGARKISLTATTRNGILCLHNPLSPEAFGAGRGVQRPVRGCGSVGRAPRSHRGGQRFESAQLHPSQVLRLRLTAGLLSAVWLCVQVIRRCLQRPCPLSSPAQLRFRAESLRFPIIFIVAASNPQNRVWHRFANTVAPKLRCFTVAQFRGQFDDLKGQFTKNSFLGYVGKETRSRLDAYTTQHFARLEYLQREGEASYRLS